MTTARAAFARWLAASVLGIGLVFAGNLIPAPAHATSQCDNELKLDQYGNSEAHGANRCITELFQNGQMIHVAWDGLEDRAYYELRWRIAPLGQQPEPGTYREPWIRLDGARFGEFDIPDVIPGVTYWVELRGCTPSFFADGNCQLFASKSIATR